ncbi:DedA family protein [Nonomuraea sp. NPDC049269]|uniref:DedA family protein n=1 Tax=Nonomuraea sp. NPDC049269 TaxID=3364349 RepID=UPI0037200CD7
MGLPDVLVCTTLGSLIGALALYWIGALLGRERVLAIAAKLPLVKVSDIEETEAWFLRHGRKTVFFGRMIPLFRSLISIPVGVERMPLPTFTLLTTVGSLIWNTVFVLAGYFLGENWSLVETYVGLGTNVVVAMVVAAVLVFVGYGWPSGAKAAKRLAVEGLRRWARPGVGGAGRLCSPVRGPRWVGQTGDLHHFIHHAVFGLRGHGAPSSSCGRGQAWTAKVTAPAAASAPAVPMAVLAS